MPHLCFEQTVIRPPSFAQMQQLMQMKLGRGAMMSKMQAVVSGRPILGRPHMQIPLQARPQAAPMHNNFVERGNGGLLSNGGGKPHPLAQYNMHLQQVQQRQRPHPYARPHTMHTMIGAGNALIQRPPHQPQHHIQPYGPALTRPNFRPFAAPQRPFLGQVSISPFL